MFMLPARRPRHYKYFSITGSAVPSRYLMTPPNLPGDTPVLDVIHPGKIIIRPPIWDNTNLTIRHNLDGGFSKRLDLDEPLRRQVRLDDGLAAITFPDRHLVVFSFNEKSTVAQKQLDFGTRFGHR